MLGERKSERRKTEERRYRRALGVALVLSVIAHAGLLAFSSLPLDEMAPSATEATDRPDADPPTHRFSAPEPMRVVQIRRAPAGAGAEAAASALPAELASAPVELGAEPASTVHRPRAHVVPVQRPPVRLASLLRPDRRERHDAAAAAFRERMERLKEERLERLDYRAASRGAKDAEPEGRTGAGGVRGGFRGGGGGFGPGCSSPGAGTDRSPLPIGIGR